MSDVGQRERVTQNRIVEFFQSALQQNTLEQAGDNAATAHRQDTVSQFSGKPEW